MQPASLVRILFSQGQVRALCAHLANILLNLAQTHQTHVLHVARANILLKWGQMYQMCVQPVSLVRIPLSLG